jgi:hypothetical protein
MAAADEGVVKYRLDYRPGPPLPAARLAALVAWQRILRDLGLVGRDPARYGGLAYGNLSVRLPEGGFAISASQTADRVAPGPSDYCRVIHWDCDANHLVAEGPARPSSESLTHAALYDSDPAIGCVLHCHAPAIWRQQVRLGLASTAADIAYGTPAMATEVARIHRRHDRDACGIMVMGGHQDGILSFGTHLDQAGCLLVTTLRKALSDS